uniref:Uncharacterized protein n=1 Tax=Glossina austeni TaxID=7395 RepID=A0A1A9VY66_GLOAU
MLYPGNIDKQLRIKIRGQSKFPRVEVETDHRPSTMPAPTTATLATQVYEQSTPVAMYKNNVCQLPNELNLSFEKKAQTENTALRIPENFVLISPHVLKNEKFPGNGLN